MKKIILYYEKSGIIFEGHPWVFPKAIKVLPRLKMGDPVEVYSEKNEYLGTGIYNEHSLYRVRILHHHFDLFPFEGIQKLVITRLKNALRLRKSLGLPNSQTTAYRLVHHAADGLDGLIIDIYQEVAVVQSAAYWTEHYKTAILSALESLSLVKKICWQSQTAFLGLEGWTQNIVDSTEETSIRFSENGLQYQFNLSQSQKTGFFLDQRDNRGLIGSLANNKRVLDLCTYHGGFALNAAHSGAAFVRAVDSSIDALTQAQKNAVENKLAITFEKDNIKQFLATHEENYDLIILDPPKLAPSHRDVKSALTLYKKLNALSIARLNEGGLLLSCSCSSAISTIDLQRVIQSAALEQKRSIRLLRTLGAGMDHPTLPSFREGDYLKALLFAVE